MNTCKTCKHWVVPTNAEYYETALCRPVDQDTGVAMQRGFEVRICKMPTQTFAEAPIESNGFGLTDASEFFATLATTESFGCVRHEVVT